MLLLSIVVIVLTMFFILALFRKKLLLQRIVRELIFFSLMIVLLIGFLIVQSRLFIHPHDFKQTSEHENIGSQSSDFTNNDQYLLFEAQEIDVEESKVSQFVEQTEKCMDSVKVFLYGYHEIKEWNV
jgi:hypothetical protein